jgi:hypothetical protein
LDTLAAIVFVLIITALFAVGGKIAFYFKNRELTLLEASYKKDIKELQERIDSEKAEINTGFFKNLKQIEQTYQAKLDEKDQIIVQLTDELDTMKQWKNDLALKIAETGGDTQNLLFKVLNLNLKLEKQRNDGWKQMEKRLTTELQEAITKIRSLLAEAESTRADSLEIINLYESHLPEDVRKKVQRELSLPAPNDRKILPES